MLLSTKKNLCAGLLCSLGLNLALHQAHATPESFPYQGMQLTYQLTINGLSIGKAVYQINCQRDTCQIYNQAVPEGLAKALFNKEILELSQFKITSQGKWLNQTYHYQTHPEDGKTYRLNTASENAFDSLNLPFALGYLLKTNPAQIKLPFLLASRKESNAIHFVETKAGSMTQLSAKAKNIELNIQINTANRWIPEEIEIRKEGKNRFEYRLIADK